MIKRQQRGVMLIAAMVCLSLTQSMLGQDGKPRGSVKPVTVPVTIRIRDSKPVEMRVVDYLLREDGEMQQILSARTPNDSPLTLAVLMQDDLDTSASVEARNIANFIRSQPGSTRVMVGYIRSGSLDLRRKFTNDLERAAQSVRSPQGLASSSPFNPFVEVIEALKRFDSQPLGRRAILLVSDGLDVSRGIDSSLPTQSIDLQRAITEAQRRSVAIYSIFVPSAAAPGLSSLNLNGQSCLEKLSSETGGRAFFQGTSAPVSFQPFLTQIGSLLDRQVALTYMSTHTSKGFHKLDIKPLERDVEIHHPAGYTR